MKLSRVLAGPVIVGATVLAQFVGISPAHAGAFDMACQYDHMFYDACLDFQATNDPNTLITHVGLDEFMSEASAREIIARGGGIRASLWADDGGGSRDHFIADLTIMPGWPAAGPTGLGVELSAPVSRVDLNEDPAAGDDDELYALVLFDRGQGNITTRRTGTVHGDFTPVSIEPDCPTACS